MLPVMVNKDEYTSSVKFLQIIIRERSHPARMNEQRQCAYDVALHSMEHRIVLIIIGFSHRAPCTQRDVVLFWCLAYYRGWCLGIRWI